MAVVTVVYDEGDKQTVLLGEAVYRGISGVAGVIPNKIGINIEHSGMFLKWKDESVISILSESDAVIFGSPAVMGSMSCPLRLFLERIAGSVGPVCFKDKFAGGFTNSDTNPEENILTLLELVVFTSRMRMIWIPTDELSVPGIEIKGKVRTSKYHGKVGVCSNGAEPCNEYKISESQFSDLLACERYGRRVALISRKWKGDGDYVSELTG